MKRWFVLIYHYGTLKFILHNILRSGVNHRIRQKLDSRRNYWLYRGICCFSITHETLTVGSKSGKFVREEQHVYPCTDCCFSDLALEKSKRVGLVQSSHHLVWYKAVIISLKCNLFFALYCWKTAHLV